MKLFQNIFTVPLPQKGFHLITEEVVRHNRELTQIKHGLFHLFLCHTSASLTLNENADSDVPKDLEKALSHVVPLNFPFAHTAEGPDDMPAHVKSSLLGCSLMIPITDGQLTLGNWQGIYLVEHRHRPHSRKLVATIWGV